MWEYLRKASVTALQSFEVTRLSHATFLLGECRDSLEQFASEVAAAALARTLNRCNHYVAALRFDFRCFAPTPGASHSSHPFELRYAFRRKSGSRLPTSITSLDLPARPCLTLLDKVRPRHSGCNPRLQSKT